MSSFLSQCASLSKRVRIAALLVPVFLAGCVSTAQNPPQGQIARPDPIFAAMYGPRPDEKFDLPATDITGIDTELLRQEVAYPTREQPGTIVVDTTNRFLYLVRENGRALRYGIGVGKEGLAWSGRATVGRKAMWPSWDSDQRHDPPRARPEQEMVGRHARWAGQPARTARSLPLRGRQGHALHDSMERRNRNPSALPCRADASVCSTRISSIYSTVCRPARRWLF